MCYAMAMTMKRVMKVPLKNKSNVQQRILSIAQDLVYNVSGGRHWTPKHVGLASTPSGHKI